MKYIFETERKNYEHFSSGRVLYNQSGATGFPVRLASEIFQRCRSVLQDEGMQAPFTLYDPCCGGGYLLTVMGLLHGKDIASIFASDIDESVLELARRNLSLLSLAGINQRIAQLKDMIQQYGKESHIAALESAFELRDLTVQNASMIESCCFSADALQDGEKIHKQWGFIDMIITDIPYGNMVQWKSESEDAVYCFLDNMRKLMRSTSVLAIISNKGQIIFHDNFKRLQHLKVGRREIHLIKLKR